ncbi:hypothetical protein BGX33_001734 [Mortierella sp. NVP41]|nr:hypothetical protein BGX33_001734 [Mortierella sp. NVP41]
MYVHGGRPQSGRNEIGQTFVLDLSTPWTTDKPAYRLLPSANPSGGTTSALFDSKSSWFLKANQSINVFDIPSETWAQPRHYDTLVTAATVAAVTDPEQNCVYVINGYRNANATFPDAPDTNLQYTPGPEQSVLGASTPLPVAASHAAVWSTLRKSALVYGGATNVVQSFYEFYPKDATFTQRTITGVSNPLGRSGHCMVEANGGSQVIVFGGFTGPESTTADIFFIDVATLAWTQKRAGLPSAQRGYAACAVSGDLFIAWGGATLSNKVFSPVSTPLVIYNMKTDSWQQNFAPTSAGTPTNNNPSSPSSSNNGGPNPTPVAAIAGGAAGALLLIGAGVGFFLHRRKRTRRGMPFVKVADNGDDDTPPSSQPTSAFKMSHMHSGEADQQQQQQQLYQQQQQHHPYQYQEQQFQQQQQYHAHPYQEQQHHYQQDPLLDANATKVGFALSPAGSTGFLSISTATSPISATAAATASSIQETPVSVADVSDLRPTEYIKAGPGRNPQLVATSYVDSTSSARNPQLH